MDGASYTKYAKADEQGSSPSRRSSQGSTDTLQGSYSSDETVVREIIDLVLNRVCNSVLLDRINSSNEVDEFYTDEPAQSTSDKEELFRFDTVLNGRYQVSTMLPDRTSLEPQTMYCNNDNSSSGIQNAENENISKNLSDAGVGTLEDTDPISCEMQAKDDLIDSGSSNEQTLRETPICSGSYSDNSTKQTFDSTLDTTTDEAGTHDRDVDHSLSKFMRDHHSSSTPRKTLDTGDGVVLESSSNVELEDALTDSDTLMKMLDGHRKLKEAEDDGLSSMEPSQTFNSEIESPQSETGGQEKPQRPRLYDMSKDSGISEGSSSHFYLSVNTDDGNVSQSVGQSEHRRLSPRSSLSDEAKQWLGKRGIRLTSMSESDEDLETLSSPDGKFYVVIPYI